MFSKELIKSLSWVAEINAIPYLSDISKIKDWITDAFFLSKLPVGSSRNKNLGFVTIALAIATLWFSPPDNFHGRWFYLS